MDRGFSVGERGAASGKSTDCSSWVTDSKAEYVGAVLSRCAAGILHSALLIVVISSVRQELRSPGSSHNWRFLFCIFKNCYQLICISDLKDKRGLTKTCSLL